MLFSVLSRLIVCNYFFKILFLLFVVVILLEPFLLFVVFIVFSLMQGTCQHVKMLTNQCVSDIDRSFISFGYLKSLLYVPRTVTQVSNQ